MSTNETTSEDENPASPTAEAGQVTTEPTLPSEYRLKLAEIATQLVSAQISASAQFESSRNLAAAVLNISEEFLRASARLQLDLDTIAKGAASDLIDCDFVGRACAKLRQSASYYREMPREQNQLDHRNFDEMFSTALSRAQELLIPPSLDETTVFAEQLFTEDQEMAESKIEKVFATWDWDVLRNHEPFMAFMEKLEDWYAAKYAALYDPTEDETFEDERCFVDHAIEFCSKRQEDPRFRSLSEAVQKIASSRYRDDTFEITAENFADAAWHSHMIQCLFCGRIPGKRKKNTTRKYAPKELFRYLRVFGQNDPIGQELQQSLQLPRKDLEGDLQPHPLNGSRSRFNFGPLSEKAEKLAFANSRG